MNASRQTSDRSDRDFRRALAVGLLASVLLHVLLALAWRGPFPGAPGGPPESRPPDPDRASAGRALRAVSVRAEERTEIPRPPEPVELASEPEVGLPRAAESTLPSGELAEPPRGTDPGGGESGRPAVRPPVPRSVLPEWEAPEAVRGSSVTVRVHVDSSGTPTGAVELVPSTSSEAFNRRLVRKVRSMRFSPARDGRGRAVAGWAELTFSF